MKKLHYETVIDAPRRIVWEQLIDPESFGEWTSPFTPGTHFVGSWDEGADIQFRTPDGCGMISVVEVHRPAEFISLRHVGMLVNGVPDTESDDAKAWAPIHENYTFTDTDGGTKVSVDLDSFDEWEEFMGTAWPKAFERLKELCEAATSGR